MSEPIRNFDRLCIHTMTTRPWPLAVAVRDYAEAGVKGISVWREHIEPVGETEAAAILGDSGLTVVSLCRGGFFAHVDPLDRQAAIDDNRRAIDTAAAIGAPLVVLVCGAYPEQSLAESRKQIADGIATVLPHAEAAGVRLSIEPLHPMYADSRSAVNTLATANDMVAAIASPSLGVTVDVYHTWWDPDLEVEIHQAGRSIFSFHICDWRVPTRDLLSDRALMGEGCINIQEIRTWVESAGFDGFHEVEIFSNSLWDGDQTTSVELIKAAYLEHS